LIARLLRAGVLTAVTDGLFSSVLAAFVYGSTVTRLWQGVASVLWGAAAFEGGTHTAAIGVLMHVGVAFGGVLAEPYGVIAVAAVYGPVIWLVMSLVVIPMLTHRPPAINIRWWVQLVGHVPFVALPIVTLIGGPRF
jgi:hypothetical protein